MEFIYKIALFINQYSNETISLEYRFYDEYSEWVGTTPLELRKNQTNKNSVFDKIQKFQYVHLNIVGDHFLEKTFSTNSEDFEQIFNQEFPTFNIQNALVNCYKLNDESSVAIFLPKFKLDPILLDLTKNAIKVSSIKISPSASKNENSILQLHSNEFKENNIERMYFSGFKKVLSVGIIVAIIFTTILFTLNIVSENHKNQNLSDNLNLTESKLQLDSLYNQYENQESIKRQNSIQQKRWKYQVLNEIALVTPNTITLTNLSLNPTSSKIRNDKPILFSNQTVFIKGSSDEINSIHSWISKINSKEWVSDVSIVEINENKEYRQLTFSILIRTL